MNDNKLFYLAKYVPTLQMWKLMGKILKPFLKDFLSMKTYKSLVRVRAQACYVSAICLAKFGVSYFAHVSGEISCFLSI